MYDIPRDYASNRFISPTRLCLYLGVSQVWSDLPNITKLLLRIGRAHTRRNNHILSNLPICNHTLAAYHNRFAIVSIPIGVVTPFLSPVCRLSITLSTSAEFLPVEAGYIIVNLIFLLGSITNTERIVNAMPFSSILSRSC